MKMGEDVRSSGRYEVLDALRGLCAAVVVALHYCEAYRRPDLLPHSHLAVEYFLTLTGFTFVVAYDARWATGALTLGRFLWRRFVRFWPVIFVGSVIGLLYCFPLTTNFLGAKKSPLELFGLFLYSLTLLPHMEPRGFLMPMQPQTWTLLYILYANVLYALVLRHLRTWMLALALVAAAGYSCWIVHVHHGFEAGWRIRSPHVAIACARTLFPVLTGMFLARLRWKLSFPGAGLVAAVLLAFVVCSPTFGLNRPAAGWLEFALVAVCLPVVLLCGCGGSIPEGRFAAFCRFLGKFSFPLYATHWPFRFSLGKWVVAHRNATFAQNVTTIAAYVIGALALAYLAMLASDALVRRLSGKGK